MWVYKGLFPISWRTTVRLPKVKWWDVFNSLVNIALWLPKPIEIMTPKGKEYQIWLVILMSLESPLDCKEIQPVHSKGGQSWVFFGRNDAKAETPVLWPSHAKSWLIGKESDAGRDWGQEEKGTTEDETAGWHHQLDGVWVNSGRWWWTGRPGVLQFLGFMGSQRVGHNWATELNWESKTRDEFPTPKQLCTLNVNDT